VDLVVAVVGHRLRPQEAVQMADTLEVEVAVAERVIQ
jgi:hypothetical protein